jgi:chromosome segregation ATPase
MSEYGLEMEIDDLREDLAKAEARAERAEAVLDGWMDRAVLAEKDLHNQIVLKNSIAIEVARLREALSDRESDLRHEYDRAEEAVSRGGQLLHYAELIVDELEDRYGPNAEQGWPGIGDATGAIACEIGNARRVFDSAEGATMKGGENERH